MLIYASILPLYPPASPSRSTTTSEPESLERPINNIIDYIFPIPNDSKRNFVTPVLTRTRSRSWSAGGFIAKHDTIKRKVSLVEAGGEVDYYAGWRAGGGFLCVVVLCWWVG